MRKDNWGRILDALSDPYRRQLLIALLESNPQDDDDLDPLDLLVGDEVNDTLETELVHKHLPKLEQMGIIEWDMEAGDISVGPNWGEIAPVLELIDDHKDELPDGWL